MSSHGLVAVADVVLLLPLMRSGGVQSNIHHRGPGRAPEPAGPPGAPRANSMGVESALIGAAGEAPQGVTVERGTAGLFPRLCKCPFDIHC